MTKFLIGCSLMFFCVVSPANDLESILARDIPGQVSTICDMLSGNASKLADKTIDLNVVQTGIVLTPQGGSYGMNLDTVMSEPSVWRGSRKLRLVTSQTYGYADFYSGSIRSIYTISGTDSRRCIFNKQDKIEQVVADCSPVTIPLEFIAYAHTTKASCWRDLGGPKISVLANSDSFNDLLNRRIFIRSEIAEVRGLGKTLVLSEEKSGRSDDPHFYAAAKYYFGIIHDTLVFLGDDTIERSMPDDGQKLISGRRVQRRLAYAQFDGYVLPNEWTHSIIKERFDAVMKPIGEPYHIRDLKYKVVSCQILNEFPMKILDVSIPTTAKFVDVCKRNQQIKAAQIQAIPSGLGRWWLVAVGCMFIFSGFAVRSFFRKRK